MQVDRLEKSLCAAASSRVGADDALRLKFLPEGEHLDQVLSGVDRLRNVRLFVEVEEEPWLARIAKAGQRLPNSSSVPDPRVSSPPKRADMIPT